MRVIRRFFAYVASILAILIITYGYVYWGNLLGESTPAGQVIAWLSGEETKSLEFLTGSKDSAPKDDTEASSALNGDKVEAEAQPQSEPELETEVEPVTEERDSAEPAVDDSSDGAQDDSSRAVLPAETPLEAEAESAESSTSETVPTETAPTETAVTKSPADAGDAAEAKIDTSEARRQPLNGITMHDLLMRARNAFHYRDYETAIASYQQLIKRAPDHFDAYIELGDVYSYQGKEKQAAAAYFEAAAILVRLGQVNRATALMGPISRMDTDRARALLDLIDQARR